MYVAVRVDESLCGVVHVCVYVDAYTYLSVMCVSVRMRLCAVKCACVCVCLSVTCASVDDVHLCAMSVCVSLSAMSVSQCLHCCGRTCGYDRRMC